MASAFADNEDHAGLERALVEATDVTDRKSVFLLPIMFLGRKLGLQGDEIGASTIGWIAHAQEQQIKDGVERPRAMHPSPLGPQP